LYILKRNNLIHKVHTVFLGLLFLLLFMNKNHLIQRHSITDQNKTTRYKEPGSFPGERRSP